MKKIGWMAIAVSLSLSVAAFATEQPKGQRPSSKGKTVRGTEAQSSQALADQIAQVKQQHQAELNELQEIRKLANEEKATKTLGALDKLIGRRNLEFEKTIGPLQQKLNALRKPGPDLPKDTKTAPKKGSPK
jgi:hypothetical protein